MRNIRGGSVTYRIRIPVTTGTRRRSRVYRRRPKSLNGGFLPILAPIIAAAIGAIPGIASVALAAKNKN